jgi:hypothetical protein
MHPDTMNISKFSNDISNTEIVYIKNFLSKEQSATLISAVVDSLANHSDNEDLVGYTNDNQVNPGEKPYVFLGKYDHPSVRAAIADINAKLENLYADLYGADKADFFIKVSVINVMKTLGDMPPHYDSLPGLKVGVDTPHGMVLYLNDDYEGGQIYYPNLEIAIKPEAGSLVMHPGTEEYLHGVATVTSGIRYVGTAFSKKGLMKIR